MNETPASALLGNFYLITTGQALFLSGKKDLQASFCMYFRKNPFNGGYAVLAGVDEAMEWVRNFKFSPEELNWLMEQPGSDGAPLFTSAYLNYLRQMKLDVKIEAVPEGRVVFANTPLLRMTGSIIHCLLLEAALVHHIGSPTLVATKASRVVRAAGKASVLEFGFHRSQFGAGLGASRAAYIGGVSATSNTLAGFKYGIPVKGTHPHAFPMAFGSDEEFDAFDAYAGASRNNLTLLVDTYDTIEGVRNAIRVFKKHGCGGTLKIEPPAGIRLDSGDLLNLSRTVRAMLDGTGLGNVKIVVSNDLDEYKIEALVAAGAPIDVYGVGTMLITAYDQPSLGAVFKLTAIKELGGVWQDRVKLSEEAVKSSCCGLQQTRRMLDPKTGQMLADMVFDTASGIRSGNVMMIGDQEVPIEHWHTGPNLLIPHKPGTLQQHRELCREDLNSLPDKYKRLVSPDKYPVGLEPILYGNRRRAIERIRKQIELAA